jgi:peptidoglycan/LPS O-acetylase OafA/YrhL
MRKLSMAISSPKSKSGYLPTLDGWRAIAIVAVILTHDSLHQWGVFSTRWFYEYGLRGVDVFFAISGVLICTRLLAEEQRAGHISLRSFYIRRAFRILPPAIVYLLCIAVLGALGKIFVYPGEWFGALLFYRNYTSLLGHVGVNHLAWFTGHFWSLSVEEHFYLLLPAILVFCKGRTRVLILSGLALAVMANRAYQLAHRSWDLVAFHTDVRLDALLIPAILAILLQNEKFKSWIGKLTRFWPLLLVLICLLIATNQPNKFWYMTSLALLFPFLVIGSVMHPHTIFGRILESAPLRYVGKLSYSLYLWQMLFFTGHLYQRTPLGVFQRWPLNLIATVACALFSYYLIERPTIRLGHRFTHAPEVKGREA